jgi:hypothetical protein
MYDSRDLHAGFLAFLFLAATYNGASFYLRESDAKAAALGTAPTTSPVAAAGGGTARTHAHAHVHAPPPEPTLRAAAAAAQ